MRVLFLSAEYPPETGWGGIGSYVACISHALAARGHDVHVLSCAVSQRATDRLEDGVWVHRRALLRIRGVGRVIRRRNLTIGRLFQGLSTFVQARRLGISYDVVEYPEWDAEGWLFGLAQHKPSVAHLHTPLYLMARYGDIPNYVDVRSASRLERLAVRRAKVVTSPSAMLADEVASASWVNRSAVRIVPHPVDWHQWSGGRTALETSPIVQFCGRLERRKAPEVLIDAIAILRRDLPEIRGSFAGAYKPGSSGVPAMDWAPRDDFEGCSFMGHVPRSALRRVVQECRVFVQPSLFENYSMAALEAMAGGRPVVLTSRAGLAEFVKEERVGEIVPTGDAVALAEALRPFLFDRSYAAEVGARAQRAVMRKLDGDRIAELREQVYEEAMHEHKSQG